MRPWITSITTEAGQQFTVTGSAEPAVSYRLQYKTNLTDTAWTNLEGDVSASGSTAAKVDTAAGETKRFYRVLRL